MQDFLKNNLSLLGHKSPELCSLIKKTPNNSQYNITISKSGIPTLSKIFPNGIEKFLHSKYDPLKEATQFIDTKYSNEESNYILIGLGLGYHLNDLHKKVSPQDQIIIFEKDPALVRLALSHNNFSDVLRNPKVSIYVDVNPKKIEKILYEHRSNLSIHGYTPIIIKPIIELDNKYYTQINLAIEQAHQKFKLDVNTQAAFSQKFYKNIFNNGLSIIESPGVLTIKDTFKNIPALVVSAGPSLDKNIGLIRSSENRILIVTVATALQPLLKNNIKPDFVVCIDPNEDTLRSFDINKIPKDLWLIYDPCIPSSISSLFNKRKIIIESKIELAKWITDHSSKKGDLGEMSSVAHSAFYLTRYLGCKPIILTGQDLSFEGSRMHCTDSFYNQANQDNIQTDQTLKMLQRIKHRRFAQSMTSALDLFDNYSITTKAMETYKYQLKKEIRGNVSVLNATEGGVNIPGATNISLKEAINKHCLQNEIHIDTSFLKKIKHPEKYKSLLTSIRAQLDKIEKIDQATIQIKNKYLAVNKQKVDKRKFIIEMESFYLNLIKDKKTIALMQGYDYIGFVEWNQTTKKINKLSNKLPEVDSVEKKFIRDRLFINRLSNTISFLYFGFKKLENELS